ncbi:unannotated protein [freshwater metagenome]|uniref:Unannotated protein n=1 Tax=freshwater metagenome TaxID=449393 RepID=A0A6J7FSF0_9ZZZZ
MSEPATQSPDNDWHVKELQRGQNEYVHNRRDDWYTEDDLVESGYRRGALVDLFGKPVPGHDGIIGWTVSSVAKIEQTQLAPAYELLQSAFGAFNGAADTMTSRVAYSSLDS